MSALPRVGAHWKTGTKQTLLASFSKLYDFVTKEGLLILRAHKVYFQELDQLFK